MRKYFLLLFYFLCVFTSMSFCGETLKNAMIKNDMLGHPALMLDNVSNVAAAYSLRQLRTAYTGKCCRVRRWSDNAEKDISFDNYFMNQVELKAFVGVSTASFSTWYDQSGNGKDATMSVAGTQPILMYNGVIRRTASGYAAMYCVNTSTFSMGMPNILDNYQSHSKIAVFATTANITTAYTWQAPALMGLATAGGSSQDFSIGVKGGKLFYYTGLVAGGTDGDYVSNTTANDGVIHSVNVISISSSAICMSYMDNVKITLMSNLADATLKPLGKIGIGGSTQGTSYTMSAGWQDYILEEVFTTAYMTDTQRTAIYNDQKAFYKTP